MPDLPIYPQRPDRSQKPDSPDHVLERRLGRLNELPEASYRRATDHLRVRLVRETLRLTGAPAEADRDASELFRGQLTAVKAIEKAASRANEPDISLIRTVHRLAVPGSSGLFRESDLSPQFTGARPSPPRFIEAKLDNLLQWLGAESGREMVPAARMALWFARFNEIAPFERGNFRAAHLLTRFFSARAGFPCSSLELSDADALRMEVERAIRFDTAPLVSRFSESLSRALRVCEEAAGADPE